MNWNLMSRLQKKRQCRNKDQFPRVYLDRAWPRWFIFRPRVSLIRCLFVFLPAASMVIREPNPTPHPQLEAQSYVRQGLFNSENFAKLSWEVSFHLPKAAVLRVTKNWPPGQQPRMSTALLERENTNKGPGPAKTRGVLPPRAWLRGWNAAQIPECITKSYIHLHFTESQGAIISFWFINNPVRQVGQGSLFAWQLCLFPCVRQHIHNAAMLGHAAGKGM